MYICPMCQKEFNKEQHMSKHLLVCWRQLNPNHKSNPAPHSEDIIIRNIDNNVLDFFNSFAEKD